MASPFEIFKYFDEKEITHELSFLKNTLHINTIRVFTPSRYAAAQLNPPWFQTDGTINPLYANELTQLVAIASSLGLRVQLNMLMMFHRYDDVYAPGANVCPISNDNSCPGSATEAFYETYLNSVIPLFRDDPNILAFEIGSESLVRSDNIVNNYADGSQDNYAPIVLSFTTRMIRYVHQLERGHFQHLIDAGETITAAVQNTRWHYPSAAFALLPDIDNLNEGRPFSLAQQVDYIASHFYLSQYDTKTTNGNYQWPACTDFSNTIKMMGCMNEAQQSLIDAINYAKAIGKPFIAGELGINFLDFVNGKPVYKNQTEAVQGNFFSLGFSHFATNERNAGMGSASHHGFCRRPIYKIL